MRLKKSVKRFLITILLIIIIFGSVILWKNTFNYQKLNNDISENLNDMPVYIEHDKEFKIEKSNYIESNYTMYVTYKKMHPEYSDDMVITYVNIGLDWEFYTNMIDTDMNDGKLIICNKYHKLKNDYVPDLVNLGGNYGGGQLEKETAEYFKKMSDAARNEGISIRNVSGYRSYSTQLTLYNNYVKRDGVKNADRYSARAGTSEHQTGLASDINSVSESFEYTDAFKWLSKNAYKYGFILRYPKGKEYITGYMYEPWHYRYVGEDVAKFIYENNITYEEYYATYILKG